MVIDLPTLMIAGSFVSAVSGVFLIFAWLQTDHAYGMLWWAAADIVLAVAIPMMASTGAVPGAPPVVVAHHPAQHQPGAHLGLGACRQPPAHRPRARRRRRGPLAGRLRHADRPRERQRPGGRST